MYGTISLLGRECMTLCWELLCVAHIRGHCVYDTAGTLVAQHFDCSSRRCMDGSSSIILLKEQQDELEQVPQMRGVKEVWRDSV